VPVLRRMQPLTRLKSESIYKHRELAGEDPEGA
jgi:hypothetical protein